MAKQLDYIKLLILGDENGPNDAKFIYRVCDSVDTALSKIVHLTVDTPVFTAATPYYLRLQPQKSLIPAVLTASIGAWLVCLLSHEGWIA